SVNGGTVQKISNTSWKETSVTYKTRPTLDGTPLSGAGSVATGQDVDFDVTGAVTGDKAYNFALVSTNSDAASYGSRESGTPPKLIVMMSGNAPAVTITAPAANGVSTVGDSVTFTGSAFDAEDGNLSSQIAWSSDLDGALGTGASISSTALRVGTHTITAKVTDASNQQSQAQTSIRVRGSNVPPVVTITAPASGATLATGTPITLTATATDDFDGN